MLSLKKSTTAAYKEIASEMTNRVLTAQTHSYCLFRAFRDFVRFVAVTPWFLVLALAALGASACKRPDTSGTKTIAVIPKGTSHVF